MSRKFSFSANTHRPSKVVIRIKGSNCHPQFDREELPAFEKFPKGSHAARRQNREERFERGK